MSGRALPKVILFAEDDPNDVLLLGRVVRQSFPGQRLQVVGDGQQALEYLEGEGRYTDRGEFPFPDLVLLDINLPKRNGLEVLAWIRSHPRLRGIVVLILTGSDSQEHLRHAYELHVNSFLKKRPLLLLPQISKGILDYWLNMNEFPECNNRTPYASNS